MPLAPAAPRGRHPRRPGRSARWRTRTLPAAALALLLAGCSGTEDTGPGNDIGSTSAPADAGQATATAAPGDAADATAPADAGSTATASPEDRVVASSDGAFELQRPEGWTDVSEEVPEDIELAIREDTVRGDFFSNLVVASEEPIPDLEQAVEEAAADVAGEDGEHEMLEPTEVDGEPAYGYLVRRTSEGTDIVQLQRWLEHGDRTYVVTFSAAAGQEEEHAALLEEILSTWTWTG